MILQLHMYVNISTQSATFSTYLTLYVPRIQLVIGEKAGGIFPLVNTRASSYRSVADSEGSTSCEKKT